jgi:hypothetical protein
MNLTPSIKGQLTKAVRTTSEPAMRFHNVRNVFLRVMPAQQAKHAAKQYLANHTSANLTWTSVVS